MSEEYAAIITRLPLFKGYTLDGAKRVLGCGEVKEPATGEVLFKEGDPPTAVFLVLAGKLQVFVERAGRDVVLTDSGPSTIVGELAVLCGIPRSASVRVIEKATVLQWEASIFRELLIKDVFLAERIFRYSLRTLIDQERLLIASLTEQEEVKRQGKGSV
jgi:CRP-like cAMP-binding protein